ncbi:MAG: hypothetical protein A2Z75_06940 [Chloroflexi bacterium RBG_13_50_10]|nr:MAG: hypothetical protein A2Z75_06940 [Chloroflexi bacterium RBG_13_50_10]
MVQNERTERKIMDNMFESYNRASKYWLDIFNSWTKTAGSFPQASGAADTERNQEGSMDIFEFYNRASKYWLDIFNSWAKTAGSFPQTFGGVGMESWLKPSWSNMTEWTRLYTRFTDMAKTMPSPFASMKDSSEAVAKGMDSYVKIYNAWLKIMDSVAREGYEIGQKARMGEEVDTAKFFETLNAAYDGINASVVESLKDTPFAGLKGLDKVVKDALDSLPEDLKIAREFLQELLSFSVKMTNLSTEVMKEVNKTSADMLAKGTISGEGYKNLTDAYGETLKHSVKILREKGALLPGYKDIADDATSWAKANLDLSISGLEMNLRLYQGIAKSSKDISKTAEELFKGEKISSADEFHKRWVEAYQQALDILVKDAQFSENIHKLMSSYAEWMKSTNKLYRGVMTPPYVAKEDFDRVSKELAKVKRSVEKQATVKVEAKEK